MVQLLEIEYNGRKYGILVIYFKQNKVPAVIDAVDIPIVSKIGNNWTCHPSGSISFKKIINGIPQEITLHELIMSQKEPNLQKNTIIHINRLGLDNRRDNLVYGNNPALLNRNSQKKKRLAKLPPNCGINPNEIPTYVWYMKPEGSHNERFVVSIGDIRWRSTSSNRVSLRYKLEEAKAFLRKLREERPEIFKRYSMNGDFNELGLQLLESFYKIIYTAGFTHIQKIFPENLTEKYLEQYQDMPGKEKELFKQKVLDRDIHSRREVIKCLPDDKELNLVSLPKYCHYRGKFNGKGDGFVVIHHPKQTTSWRSSLSTRVPLKEKYNQMLEYLKTLE